jgi:hypothetical protein
VNCPHSYHVPVDSYHNRRSRLAIAPCREWLSTQPTNNHRHNTLNPTARTKDSTRFITVSNRAEPYTASASAQNSPRRLQTLTFHGVSARMSEHQAKQTQSEQVFKIKYSACSGDSAYHDLQCNHRIRSSDLSESCGANCVKAARANPFVCPDCVVNDVRLEMDFQGLTL